MLHKLKDVIQLHHLQLILVQRLERLIYEELVLCLEEPDVLLLLILKRPKHRLFLIQLIF